MKNYFTQLFIYFITVNKYRSCISVIGYINMQIIGIRLKKKYIYIYWSITIYVITNEFLGSRLCFRNLIYNSLFKVYVTVSESGTKMYLKM